VTTLPAYAYIRSTRHETSADVDRHTAELDEHAARNGLRVIRVFVENDPANPAAAFDRMILEAAAAGGGTHWVLAPNPAHMSANPLVGARHVRRLSRMGMRVDFVSRSAVHPARADPPPGHDVIHRRR
jgi:hypothetical protein